MCDTPLVSKPAFIVYGVIGAIIVIVSIILIVSSFNWVAVGYYGIQVNWIVNHIDPLPKDEGRYFTGLGYGFILYPKTLQTLEFSKTKKNFIAARTKDGLKLELDVTLQYQLIYKEIFQLFRSYMSEYKKIYGFIVRDVVRDVASHWTALQFFNNRSNIANNMALAISNEMATLHAHCPYLQLLRVDLPNKFEAAIENTKVAQQEQEKAMHEQSQVRVESDTKIMLAKLNAKAKQIEANGTAQQILLTKTAEAQTINITATATAQANRELAAKLGINPEELLQYLYIETLRQHQSDKIVFGSDKIVV